MKLGENEVLEYLLVLIFVLLVCAVVKWRLKLVLFNSFKEAFAVTVSLFVIGSVLDSFAVFRGYWNYDNDFLVGVNIGLLPLEEYLFMLVIPFLTLTVYAVAKRKKHKTN